MRPPLRRRQVGVAAWLAALAAYHVAFEGWGAPRALLHTLLLAGACALGGAAVAGSSRLDELAGRLEAALARRGSSLTPAVTPEPQPASVPAAAGGVKRVPPPKPHVSDKVPKGPPPPPQPAAGPAAPVPPPPPPRDEPLPRVRAASLPTIGVSAKRDDASRVASLPTIGANTKRTLASSSRRGVLSSLVGGGF